MKIYKKLLTLFLAGVMIISLAACSNQPSNSNETNSPETQAQAGSDSTGGDLLSASDADSKSADNDLVIAIEGSISTLDPHNVTDTNSIATTRGIYETLVEFDENQELVGLLAESWEISEDSLTYTFNLREGVKFQDGTDFNSAAVKANFERLLDADNGLSRRRAFVVTNADETETPRIASIETPDDYTVVFQLTNAYSVFINKMAQISIVSPAAIEEHGNDIMYNPCGTGPFVYKEWTEGDHTTMIKNEDYWGEVASVDSVTIKEVPEAGSRTAMLQTGEADFVYPMPADQIAAVENSGDITVSASASNIMRYVTLNTELEALSDVRVRQAMNYAIDKEAYIQLMYAGYAEIASSTVPSIINFHSEQTPYTYDLAKAKSLLEEAGYGDGFTLTLWGDNSTQEIKGMTFIKQQLEQIGITVEVVPMEPATVSDKIYVEKEDAEIQMWYVNWSASDFSMDSSMRALLVSTYAPPTSANTAFYNNPEFDDLMEQGLLTADEAEQSEIYAKAQEIAWNDAPWLFLANDQVIYATKSYLSDVRVRADGSFYFVNAVLAQ